jgi:hypothetical protein
MVKAVYVFNENEQNALMFKFYKILIVKDNILEQNSKSH